jgi:parallel beta-helix repeat protein
MLSKPSGVLILGMVIAVMAVAIPSSLCLAGPEAVRDFSLPADLVVAKDRSSVCLPIPDCEEFHVTFEADGSRLEARLVDTANIRQQRVAIYEILSDVEPSATIDVRIAASGLAGDFCVDTGPLKRLCRNTLVGYGIAPEWQAADGPGTVSRCQNIEDCRAARADILVIVGHALYSSSYVDSLAGIWATRMGLNVAVIDAASISVYSPIDIRDFIKTVYNTATAEHFGDGRLGFVVLLGDAYENDNLTRMVPEYDGYGGDASASDHFYACIAGSDDFEDVMIGRIPVGTEVELVHYFDKLSSYTPLPTDAWTKSVLFAGGCYFAQKQDYVVYFDSLEAYVPDDIKVSRYYRQDFPATAAGDNLACQAMRDSLNAGMLFLLYSGDGDKWDWGGLCERVFRSAMIDNLSNAGRLPIVLSISCSNGWFDNATQTYLDGGVDCFAERMLAQEEGGAIACLASSREAGGNASVVFAPQIIKSAFLNGSTFLGELILEAKTRHLINLGEVIFVRQFNLFGDPCLNFDLNELPVAAPDLLIRPYSVKIGPDFPLPGKPVEITAEVWNASGVFVDRFSVGLYAGNPDSGGALVADQTYEDFWGWEKRGISFVVNDVDAGDLSFFLVADASDEVAELDEENNLVTAETYVYPFERGYPVKIGDKIKGQAVADLDADGCLDILITSGGTYAAALDFEGSLLWAKENLGLNQVFGSIKPSAFDLNGDGATEAILTTKSSLLVVEGATGSTIWQRYTEYPVLSPVVADLDGDGSFEILMSTYDYMFSRIHAFDAAGAYVWSRQLTTYQEKLTGIVVCDNELDGYKEVIFCTDDGDMTCLTCSADPPGTQWDEHLSASPLVCMSAGDIDRDGVVEIVAAAGNCIYVVDASDGAVEETVPVPQSPNRIALGDLDGDRDLEIVCTSQSGWILGIDGTSLILQVNTGKTPVGSPVLADLDQDGVSEIVVATEEGSMSIIRPSGTNFIAPVPMKGFCLSGANTEDVDLDGNIELLAGSSDSLLFVLDLGTPGGRVDWPCMGGTVTRTGLYAQPVFGSVSGHITLSGRLDVVGDVRVESGGRLSFERGSDIRFVCDDVSPTGSAAGKCEMEVEGELIAVGSAIAGIDMGPINRPYDFDDWMGVLLKSGSCATLTMTNIFGAVTGVECQTSDAYVSECTVKDCMLGIKITEAAPLIDHNTVTNNNYGISTNQATPIIVGNDVRGNFYAGVILSTSSNAILEDNVIGYTTQGHGISCYSSSPSILGGNKIRNNSQCGIYLSNSSPTVDSCWIAFNADCGIKAAYYSNPVISKTTIAENRIGVAVYVYANPIIGDTSLMLGGQNDIRQNSQYALYNATANLIKAQSTWWGSDPPAPSIFVGNVDYSGWLSTSPAGVDGPLETVDFALGLYPNPFVHKVALSLALAENQVPVDIDLYDVRGRLVRRLAHITASGEARLEWDGRDEFGSPVASGTYYIAIRSRTGMRTSKLVLIR